MIDYDIARENFVNMGEMMLRLIYQVLLKIIYNNLDEHWMARISFFLYWVERGQEEI